MQERRRMRRTAVLKVARIAFNDWSLRFDCTVSNITTCGATIDTTHPTPDSETLALSFDGFRSARDCRVMWRDKTRLGVAFRGTSAD
jgi:hypothetical protein